MNQQQTTLEKVRYNIEQFGWSVVSAAPAGSLGYSYTIGLSLSFSHPEVIISGLSTEVAHNILNDLAIKIKQGETFLVDTISQRVFKNYPAHFKRVSAENILEYFSEAFDIYQETSFTAVQCVWPNQDGDFPEASTQHQTLFGTPAD